MDIAQARAMSSLLIVKKLVLKHKIGVAGQTIRILQLQCFKFLRFQRFQSAYFSTFHTLLL